MRAFGFSNYGRSRLTQTFALLRHGGEVRSIGITDPLQHVRPERKNRATRVAPAWATERASNLAAAAPPTATSRRAAARANRRKLVRPAVKAVVGPSPFFTGSSGRAQPPDFLGAPSLEAAFRGSSGGDGVVCGRIRVGGHRICPPWASA